jgi:hypothetical protein
MYGEEERCMQGFWWENLRKDLDIDRSIVLKWIFRKWGGWRWTGLI